MNEEFSQEMFGQATSGDGAAIDFKRVLYRVLRYWYFIVISLGIALGIAYLKNRYATRIYPVTASILIKESKEGSEAKLLYNNPLISFYRNYYNELYLIQSYPLIQRVVEDLNFSVSFFREGNFMITEAYDYIPVQALVLNDGGLERKKLIFNIEDDNHFALEQNGDSKAKNRQVFNFGDTIEYSGLTMVFTQRMDRDFSIFKKENFAFLYARPENITQSYVSKLKVSWAEQGASVIDLSIVGPNPSKEVDFLNGFIKQYQAYDLERKNQAASRAIDFIESQLAEIRDSLNHVEMRVQQFKSNSSSSYLDKDGQRLYDKLESLDLSKTNLLLNENYYKYLIEYIRHGGNLDQIIMPTSVGITDGILADLLTRMIDLQTEIKLYVGRHPTVENPIILEKQKELDEIKRSIIESVENQRSTEKITFNFYDRQIRNAERELSVIPAEQRQYVTIQRNYSLMENLYVYLMQKMAEANISRASTTTDVVTVNPPKVSGGAISPRPGQNYLIALLLGILVPFAVFLLIEVFNNKIQSKEDMEKITNVPLIGGIGHNKYSDNKVVLLHPKSSIAESFRALRSNLMYFTGNKEKALFLISSSISGEGKTFTTINLASVLALSGKRTLIVGADLRKPKLFHDFDLHNNLGLSNYLAGLCGYNDIIQRTSYQNLDLVSGGAVPPNPSELLLNEMMDQFVKESVNRYDYVIIDTPPMAVVSDAHLLTKYADHTLFVVRQNYTPRQLLRTIQEYYNSGRLTKISLLFNDVHTSGPGYGYGHNYGYGYGYGYNYGYGYYDDDKNFKPSVIKRLLSRRREA